MGQRKHVLSGARSPRGRDNFGKAPFAMRLFVKILRPLVCFLALHCVLALCDEAGKRGGWRRAAAGSGSGDDAISRSTPLSQAVVLADQQLSADRLARGQHRRVSLHARAACRLYYASCAVNQPLHIHLPGEYLALVGSVA